MINVLEVGTKYKNQWVVLDRGQNVVDFGPDLTALWEKHKPAVARLTFYYASSMS